MGILFTLLLLAGSPSSHAQTFPPPAPWPSTFSNYTLEDGTLIRDPYGDESPSYADLSGISGSTVLLASNGTHVFFRMLLRDNPLDSKGNFSSATWLVQIAVNGTHVVSVGLDGKPAGNNDFVYVVRPDGTGQIAVYTGGTLVPGTAARALPVGNGEWYLDYQVPIVAITAVAPSVTPTTPVQLFYGSSATNQVINKDYMLGAYVNFSGLATVAFSGATLTLNKTATVVSGPNPPQLGQTTVYDLTLKATNFGANPLTDLNITDTFPTGVMIVGASTASGTISTIGQTVTWLPAILQPGLSATATIRVSFAPTAAHAWQNVTLNPGALGTGRDLIYPSNTTSATSNSISVGPVAAPVPDLLIRKGTDPETAYAIDGVYQTTPSGGQVITQSTFQNAPASYAIKVENDGTVSGPVVLKAIESAEPGWSVVYRIGGTPITAQILSASGYTIASLAPGPGNAVVLTVEVTPGNSVPNGETKSVTVRAFLSSDDTSVRDAVEAKTTAISLGNPLLSLSKSADLRDAAGNPPSPWRTIATTKDYLHYTIIGTNTGAPAHNVVVTDFLPPGVALQVGSVVTTLPAPLTAIVRYSNDGGATWGYVPVANAEGVDPNVQAIQWTISGVLSHLAPDNQFTLAFRGVVQPGIRANTVALNVVVADYQNNAGSPQPQASATAATRLSPPGLTIQPNNVQVSWPGAIVLFPHTITNTGVAPDPVNVRLTATQDWPITLYRDANANGQLDPADSLLTDTNSDGLPDLGSVNAGESAAILVRVAIPSNAPYDATLVLTVVAQSARDPQQAATAVDFLNLSNRPALSITKYIQTPGNTYTTATPGTVVTYGLIATNTGPTQATDVVILDTLPPFTTYIPGSTQRDGVPVVPDPYDPSSRLIRVSVGSLAPGASVTIIFQAQVN